MSASTVSITANPAARRRPVAVGDKKPGVEFVGADGVVADKVSDGKDLSHSYRGEAVLERSRDVVQVKKALPTSATATTTLPPRRTNRKGVLKPEKPRWQTVISVFTKNFLLLLVLSGLVQMIRRLALNSGSSSPITSSSSTGVSEFERRIAEVEAFLKTTTKMMQVQVEVVDRKIENEIGGLRRELTKKIEDRRTEFQNELNKLDSRTESLEKSLVDLRATDWFSKEDLDKFFDEVKKAEGPADDHGNGDVNLDAIRGFAREIVEKEIEKLAADGMGRVDYALASGGAVVTKHSEPYPVGRGSSSWIYTTNRNGIDSDAVKMLRPSFGEPGQCFPLKGSCGFVHIRLRTAIIPEAITLEHVAKSVAYDRSSAPKDCKVFGWLQGHDTTNQVVDKEKMFLLTEFTYDLEKSNIQTFNVLHSAGSGIIDTIRLDFTSNYGSPHTCIYRLRVHGHEPNSISLSATES